MLSGSLAVLFEVFFPVPEALEHPHARQAVISIIDKIGEKFSTVLVWIDMAGKYW